MTPFTYIEKWISEHGSAIVLRDHNALLKSQMEALQVEVSSLKEHNKNIETERDKFKAQSEKLQTQLDDARVEIKRRDNADRDLGIYEIPSPAFGARGRRSIDG